MTKLEWDLPGTRFYESGVDRGIIFVDGGNGAIWNGLTNVEERTEGGDIQPYYVDGFRYLNVAQSSEFAASITAFSTPPEFDVCIGNKSISTGLYATSQWVKRFDFSYRTMIGSDGGEDKGYKLHLVYNALAKRNDSSYATHTNVVDPVSKTFDISTVPVKIPGYKPTAHLVIDSREANPFVLGYLEAILYGTNVGTSRMPSIDEVIALFGWIAPDIDFPINILGEGDSVKEILAENLFTNPNLIGTGTTATLYENLAINGSFKKSLPQIVYVNFCKEPNPKTVGTLDAWTQNGTGGGASASFVPATDPDLIAAGIDTVYRLTGGSPAANYRRGYVVTGLTVGSTYKLTLWSYHSTQARYFRLFQDTSQTVLAEGDEGWAVGEAGWKSIIWTATQTSVRVFAVQATSQADPNYVFDVSACMVVNLTAGIEQLNFFSGSYSPSHDLTPYWLYEQEPNASISYLAMEVPLGVKITGDGIGYKSYDWSESGDSSLKLCGSPVNDSGQRILSEDIPLEVGATYTAMGTINMPEGPSGIGGSNRRLQIRTPTNAIMAQSEDTTAIGVTNIRMVFTATETIGRFFLDYRNAFGKVWYWDNLFIVKGEYTGPVFDGDNPHPDPDFITVWSGEENASTSLVTGEPVAGVTGFNAFAIRSSDFGGSVRIIPTAPSGSAIAYMSIPVPARSGGTAIATIHQKGPLTNFIPTRFGERQIRINTGNYLSEMPPNEEGSYPLRVTFPAVASTYQMQIYAGNGLGGGDLYFSMPGIFVGDYDGPWFAPGNPIYYQHQMLDPEWTGAENNSSSVLTANNFLNKTGTPGDTYIIDGEFWTYHPNGYWFKSGEVPTP